MSDVEFDRLDFLCVRAGYIRRLFAAGESAEEVAEATQCNDIGQVRLIALTDAAHITPGEGIASRLRDANIRGQIEALRWVLGHDWTPDHTAQCVRDRLEELRKELE